MGVNFSRSRVVDAHCPPESEAINSQDVCNIMEQDTRERNESEEEIFEVQENVEPRSHAEEMIQFKKDLAIKREQRKKIIAKHASEKENLRASLIIQVKANEVIKNENKLLKELLERHNIEYAAPVSGEDVTELSLPEVLLRDLETSKERNRKLQKDLAETNLALQSANADMSNLQCQNADFMKHINALKEVVAVTKTMMKIRESQLTELKDKLAQIESSLADREASLLSEDLRAEYERQLQNIRTLRALYEERARLADVTRMQLVRELEEQKVLAAVETSRCNELTEKVAELEAKMSVMSDTIDNKDDQISLTAEESRGLKDEMSTVNKLFSQMLLGYKSQQDLDKLVSRLEEHHGLLAHMVTRDGSEASSALPKLLLDLVSQVDEDKGEERPKEEDNNLNTTAEEIVGNLPKVWRVLMELLSHQAVPENTSDELHPSTCYKPVDTPSGIRMVPSVSQTYIRLKDLIVEKLSLTKEMNKMKQLNAHLGSRLEEQERRLCLVTSELSKTWHVVGRLRRHHHQLHTHEKILRYELQQKRKMLNELKEELEFCKEKWDKAKEKNTESEIEWRKLRSEFSSRKNKVNCSLNNSGESGYSDERQTEDDSTESNDESEYVNDPPIRCKKRIKKSFDVLPDSSTDANPVAEREDPISDLLDVADLPLDGLDVEEREDDLSTSESCVSDNFVKSPCPLAFDGSTSSTQAHAISEKFNKNALESAGGSDSKTKSDNHTEQSDYIPVNTPQEILENIRKQNERLENKNQRLNSLEASSASLMKQVTKTAELRHEIDERLQKLRNRREEKPSSSKNTINDTDRSSDEQSDLTQTFPDGERSEIVVPIEPDYLTSTNNKFKEGAGCSKSLKPKEILENVRIQSERAENQHEDGCSSPIPTSTDSIHLEEGINVNNGYENSENSAKSEVNEIQKDYEISNNLYESGNEIQDDTETVEADIIEECSESSGPSTSRGPIDHEARFAARDERLKRLEEQTKSLVNKVNDTTTKTMKISYKLEELHNIYGSEGGGSRNQTPDNEEETEPREEN